MAEKNHSQLFLFGFLVLMFYNTMLVMHRVTIYFTAKTIKSRISINTICLLSKYTLEDLIDTGVKVRRFGFIVGNLVIHFLF